MHISSRSLPSRSAKLSVAALAFVASFVLAVPGAQAHGALSTTRGADPTPRGEKLEALARLEFVRDSIRDGSVLVPHRREALEELDDAIEELEESLAPELWAGDGNGGIDFSHLDPEEGHEVFHEERECAQEIFDAIREGGIGEGDTRTELLLIVDLLVLADRGLADIAIAEASDGDPHELSEALAAFAEGDARVSEAASTDSLRRKAPLLYAAMDDSYRHAWQEAVDAVAPDSEHLEVPPCCLHRRSMPTAPALR